MGSILLQAACSGFIHLRNYKINEINATLPSIHPSLQAPLQETENLFEPTEWDPLQMGKEQSLPTLQCHCFLT